MKATITGDTFPLLEVELGPGDRLIAEPGEFSWMTQDVQMRTSAMVAGATSWLGAIGRAMAGAGLFLTEYSSSSNGRVAFAAKVPGAILPVTVSPGHGYLVHRHGFLCASGKLDLKIGFQRSFTAGLFGGSGFILQRLGGSCAAWIELGGQVISYELKAQDTLLVHPGHVGMFEESVQFDITTIPGIKNVIFGGNGLFVARLRGPGTVWLQTLTLPNLAHALGPFMAKAEGKDNIIAGGIGALLRGVVD
jgi:uncharacterized protein (AIM24 family)